MPRTVGVAFQEFQSNCVNLSRLDYEEARSSRNFLKSKINNFPLIYDDFPNLVVSQNLDFGSLARHTRIIPLDDIDFITCMHAEGSSYRDVEGVLKLTVPATSRLNRYLDSDGYLSSIRIIERFKSAIKTIHQYSESDVKRRGEAVVLNLKTRPWNFDIVPGFMGNSGWPSDTFYVIPNGTGHWKKTDPRIDKARTTNVNVLHDGNVLNVIRTIKFWQRRTTMTSIPSYVIETIVLDYYENRHTKASHRTEYELFGILRYISSAIMSPIPDPTGIEYDMNTYSQQVKEKIRDRANLDALRCLHAQMLESQGKHEEAIREMILVFGPSFPSYG